jgi:hypothetical protein
MIPLLNILLLSISPIENFVSLKTYISSNVQLYFGTTYYIYVDGIITKDKDNLIEKSKDDFKAFLKSQNVIIREIGGYFFFIPEQTND